MSYKIFYELCTNRLFSLSSADECSWCNKSITSESGALQQAGATFCSELCFSQSRRANFKRAKTCDWCRHVRHTVAYVDFQVRIYNSLHHLAGLRDY